MVAAAHVVFPLLLSRTPVRQTPYQAALVSQVNTTAAVAAAAARPLMLQALDAPSFRSALAGCCAGIARESAPSLLARLEDELRTAELTHNFNANSSGTWEGDVNITTAHALNYLPNLWTLEYLGLAAAQQRVEDLSEVNIMGFRPF